MQLARKASQQKQRKIPQCLLLAEAVYSAQEPAVRAASKAEQGSRREDDCRKVLSTLSVQVYTEARHSCEEPEHGCTLNPHWGSYSGHKDRVTPAGKEEALRSIIVYEAS